MISNTSSWNWLETNSMEDKLKTSNNYEIETTENYELVRNMQKFLPPLVLKTTWTQASKFLLITLNNS